MIIESIITTTMPDGSANIAPMGPFVDEGWSEFELRPFGGSQTLKNLVATKCGVVHLVDDSLLFVQAITKHWIERPCLVPATKITGWVIPDACSWREFVVTYADAAANRAILKCRTVEMAQGREFAGFCRGKHAILEAAIAASRAQFLPSEEITAQLAQAEAIVGKTGGPREKLACELLNFFLRQQSTIASPTSLS